MLALAHYGWPYNVRELESAVKLSIALKEGDILDAPLLPPNIQDVLEGHGKKELPPSRSVAPPQPAPKAAKKPAPTEAELRALLTEHQGNIAAVGRALGKERMQIHRWAKRFGLNLDEFRRRS